MGNVIQFSRYCKATHRAAQNHAGAGAAIPRSAGGTVKRFDRSRGERQSSGSRVSHAVIPDVSVVVPTCGRPTLLNRCLEALIRQSLDMKRYEIIVVDDAPNQATRDAVENWSTRMAMTGLAIHYLPSFGPHGPAAARNKGWRSALAPIVAFTDDDTTPARDWLTTGLDAFEDGAQAVWGRIVMPIEGTPTDYERDAKGLETAEFVTANCLCRKSVLEELDGFDERFRLAWREDADFYFRLLKNDVRVRHVPEAVVIHPVRSAQWGVSLLQQKKVVFDVLLFKKHPLLYREKIRPGPRWDYYLTVLSLLVCLTGATAGAQVAAALSGALWLTLTARFCAARLRGTAKTPSHIAEMIVTSALIPPVAVFWRIVGMLRFRTILA
jgi:GT2 family glycosyltransferase